MDQKKTIVIVDHPNYSQSTVNRRLVEEMKKHPDEIYIHNLQSCYPTGVIDPYKEHSVLDMYGSIVLQFPLYWFNCPPKTKEWFDKVLTSNWAFKDGHHLEGKKIGICISCGSEESAYTEEGNHHQSVEKYLSNMIHAFEMCHAQYAGLFGVYGINDTQKMTANDIATKACEYIDFIDSIKA